MALKVLRRPGGRPPRACVEETFNKRRGESRGRRWWDVEVHPGTQLGGDRQPGQGGPNRKLNLLVTGTQTESLLKAVGGRCKEMEVHLCGRPCEAQVWNNQLIHGDRVRRQMDPAEGWWTNLEDARGRGHAMAEEPEAVDQLAKLRTEMKKVVDGV